MPDLADLSGPETLRAFLAARELAHMAVDRVAFRALDQEPEEVRLAVARLGSQKVVAAFLGDPETYIRIGKIGLWHIVPPVENYPVQPALAVTPP